MRYARYGGVGVVSLLAGTIAVRADTTSTVAAVNDSDMIEMQELSPRFAKANAITLSVVALDENVLRQRVTTDIATKGGSFDVMIIGACETPVWGQQGWLVPLDDVDDGAYDRSGAATPRTRPFGRIADSPRPAALTRRQPFRMAPSGAAMSS